MDSLTQIVLGAGVGELILGRKLGNRAMVWGGIAGTIPDLDILSSPFLTPAESLHAHRGFSHSVFFAVMAPFLYAYLINKLYSSGLYLRKPWMNTVGFFAALGCLFIIAFPSLLGMFLGGTGIGLSLFAVTTTFAVLLFMRFIKNYLKDKTEIILPSYKELYWFFFWTTFTHPILDCFTVYGTQLFAPISDVRISWDNISVADPAYTLIFGIPLIIAAFYRRTSKTRFAWMLIGLGVSTMYMGLTFRNKEQVNEVVQKTIQTRGLQVERFMTNPTILNNILWSASIETKDTIYYGLYSLNDQSDEMTLSAYAKNYQFLQDAKGDDYDVNTIKWFSNGYYSVIRRADGRLQMNDMRYGIFGKETHSESAYVFKFILNKYEKGYYHIDDKSQEAPGGDMKAAISDLFTRARGI